MFHAQLRFSKSSEHLKYIQRKKSIIIYKYVIALEGGEDKQRWLAILPSSMTVMLNPSPSSYMNGIEDRKGQAVSGTSSLYSNIGLFRSNECIYFLIQHYFCLGCQRSLGILQLQYSRLEPQLRKSVWKTEHISSSP